MSIFRDKDKLTTIVSQSSCLADVLRGFGFDPSRGAGNFRTAKRYIAMYEIDTSHFDPGKNRRSALARNAERVKKPIEDIISGDVVTYAGSSNLKAKLFKAGIKQRICEECGIGEEWNGKMLTLQLDHVDGDHKNNLLGNLRILCPNCHSQTITHSRKSGPTPRS